MEALSLIALSPDHLMGQEDEETTRRFISRLLDNHGTTFRKYRNTLVFLAPDAGALPDVITAARSLTALRGIATDRITVEQLSEEQRDMLYSRLDDARSALPQRIAAAYRHVVAGGPEKSLQVWDIGARTYDISRTLSQRVWDTLKDAEKLLEKLDPRLIIEERWALWPEEEDALRVADLWDYFVRYTHLPMLKDQTVLTGAVVEGLERGLFGYRLGDGEKLDFDTFYPPGRPPEGGVRETPPSAWLVRREIAVQIAPPPTPGPTPVGPPTPTPLMPTPPVEPVQPPLIEPRAERRYQRVVIRTPVRWENWQDFYNEVIDPLIREGAEVAIRVEVTGQSEGGIRENTVELGIKESLFQRGVTPEIAAE